MTRDSMLALLRNVTEANEADDLDDAIEALKPAIAWLEDEGNAVMVDGEFTNKRLGKVWPLG